MTKSPKVTLVLAFLLACALASYASAPLLSVMAPRQAHLGGPLLYSYTVTNPLTTPLSVTATYSISGPCISESGSQQFYMASVGQLGSTQSNNFSYTIPSSSNCAGTYKITVSVSYGENQIANVSKTVPVS